MNPLAIAGGILATVGLITFILFTPEPEIHKYTTDEIKALMAREYFLQHPERKYI